MSAPPRYRSVILDVDSTLCGVEGIDWLARQRGADVADQTALLTQRAMAGEIPLESVYGERLALIRPTLREITALSAEYRRTLAADAPRAISALRGAGVEVVLISGGIRKAIEPVALELGLAPDHLFAVELRWDVAGGYVGFDTGSPLTFHTGKFAVVQSLKLNAPRLAVGDGATDVAMRGAVDAFAAYTGFAYRESVVERADFAVRSYKELLQRVLPV